MPVHRCPYPDCTYATEDVSDALAVEYFAIHRSAHAAPAATATQLKQKPPKIDRPTIADGSSEEVWNAFKTRWTMFKGGTQLTAEETLQQLFECCEKTLGDAILKGYPNPLQGTEQDLMDAIKKLAVIPVSRVVRRTEVLNMKQGHGESVRHYQARVTGKATTCGYSMQCVSNTCNTINDFTSIIVKDVVINGLDDEEIRKDVHSWTDVDAKTVEQTVSFVEGKEMARDALRKPPVAAALTSSTKTKLPGGKGTKIKEKINCADCHVEIDKFFWHRRRGRMVECTKCQSCWQKEVSQKEQQKQSSIKTNSPVAAVTDETSALLIGVVSEGAKIVKDEVIHDTVPEKRYRLYGVNVPELDPSLYYDSPPTGTFSTTHGQHPSIDSPPNEISSSEHSECPAPVILDHHIFDSRSGWRRSESMAHPTLRLRVSTNQDDYSRVGASFPDVMPSYVTVVTDTGAQSCLWSLADFYRCGFKDSDLIPVKRTMVAANQDEIVICGAIFLRLSGKDRLGNVHTAHVMAYVSPSTSRFYLSREALVQLGVISKSFPQIGAFTESCPIEDGVAECGCQIRSLPPTRPATLPFRCCPENNEAMRSWLITRYSQSTFNKCPHQKLDSITGPELKFHIKPSAKFKVAHTPSTVALHDQEEVKAQLDADVDLGVLENVPYNEPSVCCHRMHIVRKADGSPRRVVDMSALNEHCLRETHHVKPPFQQAKSIPRNTWKSVTDAWNGYHSVPLCKEDRYLTTFITPWGRYRYKVAPQGSAVSGDAYNRRSDEVLVDVQRKTKCVDDTALWDEDLEEHWWRMMNFLDLAGKNGIVLNHEKFQFAQREVDFAGFRVTDTSIKPLDKYLKAIVDFPTPKKTTDIRAWFGLVNHVSHYNRLIDLVSPFRVFLGKNKKFEWNSELDEAFQKSKLAIVDAIKEGVEIFDLHRPTCLQTDYSKIGIGYFLSQKHCMCPGSAPGCCEVGWRITLAGSRFLKPAESRYHPIEGEALAVAWSLEQTKYFTQGCPTLTITTDHKPLLGILSSSTPMDQIPNPRLFSLKQRTLPWSFKIEHLPGKDNKFPDAASRFPSPSTDEVDVLHLSSLSMALAAIRMHEYVPSTDDEDMIIAATLSSKNIRAVTWELVREETSKDTTMQKLIFFIRSTFPLDKSELPTELAPYWSIRDSLYVVDGVILMRDRIVLPKALRNNAIQSYLPGHDRILIPSSLRGDIVNSLHSAHQGITSMNERAKAGVYWPGITADIVKARNSCGSCNRNMPSHSRIPPVEPHIPTTPFEAIACDYFHYIGRYYFVAADRLSGWIEVQQIKVGTSESGAKGLCTALRRLMVTFGVPIEISSDGGPEFISGETQAFFKRWGIRHRLSSVSFPSSNGRAELAVKTAKRLLEDNVDPDGKLDNDSMVRALLTLRNTPDPGCKLSPAQILLGRQLRDSLPCIDKRVMMFNNPEIQPQWRDAWKIKEDALRTRYVKTIEDLSEHARPLVPLRHGDHVMLQNQRGRHPNKWDSSGVIVETKPNDQYVVKITGSGRLTLRNRRFLRLFTPHKLVQPEAYLSPTNCSPPQDTGNLPSPCIDAIPQPCNGDEDGNSQEMPVTPCPHPKDSRVSHVDSPPPRLLFGDFPPQSPSIVQEPPLLSPPSVSPPSVSQTPQRHSSRQQKPRTIYDANSGTFKQPLSVPEDI